MGTGKKEKVRKERQGKVVGGMSNVKSKGENFYRYRFLSLSWSGERPAGKQNLKMCKQVGQEGEDLEHVQGRKSATKRRWQGHQSCLLPVSRAAQGPD